MLLLVLSQKVPAVHQPNPLTITNKQKLTPLKISKKLSKIKEERNQCSRGYFEMKHQKI